MLKQLFVSVILFAFVTVQANAATNNSLKAAFDQLNYSLSVEWDQKDPAFRQAQLTRFNETVAALQAQGLTNAELTEFALGQVKDQALSQELKSTFTLIQLNQMSAADARNLILEKVNQSVSNAGASWNGFAYISAAVVLVALIVVAAGGGYVAVGSNCYEDYVCDYYACYYDT